MKPKKPAAPKKARKASTGKKAPASNLQKRLESERISADIARFRKEGGTVEKLGVTKVLQKV